MMTQPEKKLIVVLGMHRSGTSAITRGLAALGVELGDNLLPPAQENNETGFWEDKDIFDFNERLLNKLGRSWDSASLIPDEAIASELHRADREEAASLIKKKLEGVSSFGIKDPRICILLPFWKSVFQSIDISPRYIICVRNPASVIHSLSKRDNLSIEKSLTLWLIHTLSAIHHTSSETRIFVDYELLLENPERELARMAECIGAAVPAKDSREIIEYTRDFLSKNLNHNTSKNLGPTPASDPEKWANEVYLACKQQSMTPTTTCEALDNAFGDLKKMSFALQQFDNLESSLKERDQIAYRLQLAQEDIRALKQAIDDIMASTSWRLSAPIRFFGLLAAGKTRDAMQLITKPHSQSDNR